MANPFDVSVTYTGYNRVRNQLRAAASYHADEADGVIEKHAKSESARLRNKPYAPMLPGQKYQRTYRMGKGFRAQRRGKAKWAVINKTKSLKTGKEYPVWVIKKGMQNRKYHFKRWWTIDDELQKGMPQLTRNLSVHLEDLLNRQRD